MLETNRIAEIMKILIENCGDCPLERICNDAKCSRAWKHFLETKVKEDGVEEWD